MDKETRIVAVSLIVILALASMAKFVSDRLPMPRSDAVASHYCADVRDRAEAAHSRERAINTDTIVANMRRRQADPVQDAQRAARLGNWGLIGNWSGFAMGMKCDGLPVREAIASDANSISRRFHGCMRGSNCPQETSDDFMRIRDYGERYNLALAAHPSYPDRDFCRPLRAGEGERTLKYHDVAPEGPPPVIGARAQRAPVDLGQPPRTIHEAARRGNLSAMQAMIAADPELLDEPDHYGISPLRWAAFYGRSEAALWLIKQGAKVDDGKCGVGIDALNEALRNGDDRLAMELSRRLPHGGRDRNGAWDESRVAAAAAGGSGLFSAIVADRHRDPYGSGNAQWLHPATLNAHLKDLCRPLRIPAEARVILIGAEHPGRWVGDDYVYNPVQIEILSDRPIFLILLARDVPKWTFTLRPGAKLTGVLSISEGALKGLPSSVDRWRYWRGETCRKDDQLPEASAGKVSAVRQVEAFIKRQVDVFTIHNDAADLYRIK